MISLNSWALAIVLLLSSCQKEELSFTQGDIKIDIEAGDSWLHDFPLFLCLTKKNPPQFAVWIEDTQGNYLSTVFVTYKIATEGWLSNNGNRRKEALPYWCHQRGCVYEDGLLLPTKKNPLVDGITGATPMASKTIRIHPLKLEKPFVVKAEFNHSIDFNGFFPKNAKKGDDNYSGGKMGSGQPAVVYAATVYPETQQTDLMLVGYSSPDGADGKIYENLERLTTAKSIVKRIALTIK